MNGLIYIFLTILFTVYGQLVIKWQMSKVTAIPDTFIDKLTFLLIQCLNPWIISSFAAAFIAALCWMEAMTKLELSFAYPFMGLTFILVLAFSGIFFHESISLLKVLGMILISLGIIVGSRG